MAFCEAKKMLRKLAKGEPQKKRTPRRAFLIPLLITGCFENRVGFAFTIVLWYVSEFFLQFQKKQIGLLYRLIERINTCTLNCTFSIVLE